MSASTPRTSLRQGLRHAPKINQPFIPDTTPARRSHINHGFTSPQPQTSPHHVNVNPAANPQSAQFVVDSWEGKDNRQVPMSTREVPTPGNRPVIFSHLRDPSKMPRQLDYHDPYFPLRYLEVPRTDHIYKRAHYGLQSGIPDEVDFALYHLVQISNQRWDKFKFEGFPLLAETLMQKALDITQLCTGVKWEFQYDPRTPIDRINVLNSLHGTRDILDKISKIPVNLPDDSLETYDFNHRLRNIKEATLVLRNMVLLKENAFYVSRYANGLLRDFLIILINAPNQPRLNEIKNDALDIAEEVTKFLRTDPEDPLWISLVNCLDSPDRAHVVRSLWALTHFGTELDDADANRAMETLTRPTLQQMYYHTLLDLDKDILSGALDFWYQYTLSHDNIETLMDVLNFPIVFVPRMVALLTYEARPTKKETVLQEEKVAPPPTDIPRVSPELLEKLMDLSEPERSSQWLRCCFIEDSECEITQIALWQAYQSRFADPRVTGGGVLPAAEFIKNVSNTFTNAQAQVINGPGTATKFIIKGIRPLETAHTFEGFPYSYCRWADNSKPSKMCQRAFTSPTDLRNHVFGDHMNLEPTDSLGQYKLDPADSPIHTCQWDNCSRFRASGPSAITSMVAGHVSSHLPEDRPVDAQPTTAKRVVLQERIVRKWYYMDTPINEKGEPFGVAYKAALVLRNIARGLPNRTTSKYGGLPWKKACFTSQRPKIVEVWDRNRALRKELTELIMVIEKEVDY
ncbi:Chromatin remodeling complex subunit (Rsc9), putative [Penicillium digitatum PHI26]|uniref:Chromatin remodeling complex subunit (Rsc9), putative n=2 Tax=Penicillium digitatum TaxID=36651 RepID=K9GBM5_PEND2|nr:Chromatin remodeling complex subunit (Rsc9), putative [Penicillium digitatum Pd1]EKV16341.1 Chromatin remodeling complex subunit (Rsc9), putative [Penicillium digitatum Pd1]EKV18557.1 Chromatin remodeling complex subunit (Rsc9), putative [Penicillium digitatum PHI26]